MKRNSSELLEEFVEGSKTFNSFTFNGLYEMSTKNFIKMFQRFVETGENYLDEFSEMTWAGWGDGDRGFGFEYFDEWERDKINRWLKGESFLEFSSFITSERMDEIKEGLALSEAHDIQQRTYKKMRINASRHTSKKEVRAQVFEIHGEVCASCGSTENIQIDHVVPVAKNGANSIDNYQPLCRSCNSSKGAK
jgi:hypothetical protein